ncbi:MAG: DNA (cytosine-5-)-methyltransferase [Nitrososphaeria archaeon]|jgi:DNA (cytosine-5)-methyltransferase 1
MALTVGDIFSGAGGFSEGFRQAGFKIKWAVDNWLPAAETFEKNLGVEVIKKDATDIDFKELEHVDVLIGSPPCQDFSLANNGGNGDVEVGMKLVSKFLEAVLKLKPDYWIMENVPNLRRILVSRMKVGSINLPNGILRPQMTFLNSADYGVPQKRFRLFTGAFPKPEQTHWKDGNHGLEQVPRWKSMRDVIESLPHPISELKYTDMVKDPVYDIQIPADKLTNQLSNSYFTEEQVFSCRKNKEDHIWAGKMCFPDNPDLPSRTITAQNYKSGRQTIVIEDKLSHGTHYRGPTLREQASFQSFPITYQFWGKTITERNRLVGNAVPPLLAFALAKAILKDKGFDAPDKPEVSSILKETPFAVVTTTMTNRNRIAPLNRKFRDYIPGSKTGSQKDACRVDLDNKGRKPRKHPMMRFDTLNSNNQCIKHLVEWETVLYTGYAESFKFSPIKLKDALQLIVQAEHDGLIDYNTVISFIDDLQELPHTIPDASTLQAVRAGRWEKVLTTPYKLMDIIRDKVNYHFAIESFDWSKRIKKPNPIKISPKTGIPVRTAAYLLACSFVCEILNESDIWIKENWALHFNYGEWPQIEYPHPIEPEWNGHIALKEEIQKQLE